MLCTGGVDVRIPGLKTTSDGNRCRLTVVGIVGEACRRREVVVRGNGGEAGIVGRVGVDCRGQPSIEHIGAVFCTHRRERNCDTSIENDSVESRYGTVDDDIARRARSHDTRLCTTRIGKLHGLCRRIVGIDTAVLDDYTERCSRRSNTILTVWLNELDNLEVVGQCRELESTDTGGRQITDSVEDIVGHLCYRDTMSLDILAIGAQVGNSDVKESGVDILRVHVGRQMAPPVRHAVAVDTVVLVEDRTLRIIYIVSNIINSRVGGNIAECEVESVEAAYYIIVKVAVAKDTTAESGCGDTVTLRSGHLDGVEDHLSIVSSDDVEGGG